MFAQALLISFGHIVREYTTRLAMVKQIHHSESWQPLTLGRGATSDQGGCGWVAD
jgi:hypothetical protein